MRLEIVDPKTLTLDDAIKHQYSLFYIVENFDNCIMPYRFLSFSKEGLALPTDKYILVKLARTSEEEETQEPKEAPVQIATKPTKRMVGRNDYKFTGMNDANTIRITPSNVGRKYGGIRVSFPSKEDALAIFDYFREQFYSRDVSSISIESIYEDLGISKERIAANCPNAKKWGYPTLNGGKCKYLSEYITKNRGDNWFGFTFDPPVIIAGMEESGWYAKQKELGLMA